MLANDLWAQRTLTLGEWKRLQDKSRRPITDGVINDPDAVEQRVHDNTPKAGYRLA